MMKTDEDIRTGLLDSANYGTLPARQLEDEPDAALALFRDEQELHEAIDPEKEGKLVRKIDYMILP